MYAELERIICTSCEKVKNADKFSKRSGRPKGKASWCKECLNEWRRRYKKTKENLYLDYEFARGLRRNYKMSVKQYFEMLNEQQFGCACCGKHESQFKRRLHVDHDHETGEIRALLCTECNPGLGYFKHSVDRLKLAITYLEKFKK